MNTAKFMNEVRKELKKDYPQYEWSLWDLSNDIEEREPQQYLFEVEARNKARVTGVEVYLEGQDVEDAAYQIESMLMDTGYIFKSM